MCLEIRIGLDQEIDPESESSGLEELVLTKAEITPPLSRPQVYRVVGLAEGCACLLMDDEGFEMGGVRWAIFNRARDELARLIHGWAQRGPVEVIAYWLGDEPLPAAAPLKVSVESLVGDPASFRASGTPYFYVVGESAGQSLS
jgi:hypothetical protein